MIVAKQVADLITSARVLIAVCLVGIGIVQGEAGLTLVAWMMIADWAGDMVDGRIARRSRAQYHTWIGDHDLEVDMTVSVGLLFYLFQAGFVNIWLSGAAAAPARRPASRSPGRGRGRSRACARSLSARCRSDGRGPPRSPGTRRARAWPRSSPHRRSDTRARPARRAGACAWCRTPTARCPGRTPSGRGSARTCRRPRAP